MSQQSVENIAIIQRILADYRRPFFERLTSTAGVKIGIIAGQPEPDEGIKIADYINGAVFTKIRNHYLNGPWGMVCWQSGIVNWLEELDPQVLVTGANPRLLSNWMAIAWMHNRKRPVLGWGLGELERPGPMWQQQLRRKLARRLVLALDGMITYSTKARDDYVRLGMANERVFVAHNSIDNTESERFLNQFAYDISWVSAWRESQRLDPSLPIVLYVGRLIPQKNVHLLIQACQPLFDRCQLLIVGDGPAKAELQKVAAPFQNRVRFAGHQTGAPLAKSFIASDVFALPGAGGLAVHQAMSYGKPIVVSFGDGTEADLVKENINGLFFKSGDINGLRSAIINLLDHSKKIQQMGAASLSIIQTQINLSSMAESFIHAIKAVNIKFTRHTPLH